LPDLGWLATIIALLVTIIEALPVPINDNVVIPLSTGIILYFVL
jgi:dolichol kinase